MLRTPFLKSPLAAKKAPQLPSFRRNVQTTPTGSAADREVVITKLPHKPPATGRHSSQPPIGVDQTGTQHPETHPPQKAQGHLERPLQSEALFRAKHAKRLARLETHGLLLKRATPAVVHRAFDRQKADTLPAQLEPPLGATPDTQKRSRLCPANSLFS
jgi:hypothetical protein